MNTSNTYEQIANNYALWTELVDVDGNMSRETFDATPVETLVAMMIEMFGADPNTRLTVSIDEDGVWATDASIRSSRIGYSWWDTGAPLFPANDDGSQSRYDDMAYEMIADALYAGDESGTIALGGKTFTWQIA